MKVLIQVLGWTLTFVAAGGLVAFAFFDVQYWAPIGGSDVDRAFLIFLAHFFAFIAGPLSTLATGTMR